jgi:hypothetical protein
MNRGHNREEDIQDVMALRDAARLQDTSLDMISNQAYTPKKNNQSKKRRCGKSYPRINATDH